MNGQKIIQRQADGSKEWESKELIPRTSVKPGFYYLTAAREANKKAISDGQIVHRDRRFLYQQCGTQLVKHELSAFETKPIDGSSASVRYKNGKAMVDSLKRDHKLKI